MAGDWLKVEISLPDKIEVWQIAALTGLDPDSVVGKLIKVWRWFDQHTESGNVANVTYPLVDSIVGFNGFSDCMEEAGWLVRVGTTLTLPNFDRHNGKTGKNRALTAKRVAAHKGKGNAEGNAPLTQEASPREEKRSIEKKEEHVPRASRGKQSKPTKTAMPEDFGVSARVKGWASEKGHSRLDQHLESFKAKCAANGYRYADWDSAFMEAIRGDWAKLSQTNGKPDPQPVKHKTKDQALAPTEDRLTAHVTWLERQRDLGQLSPAEFTAEVSAAKERFQ